MDKAKDKDITFEAALARLEEIVNELENGNAQLDQSLAIFEEGVALVKLCGEKLDNAERRIKVLTKNRDGEYEEHDFGKTE